MPVSLQLRGLSTTAMASFTGMTKEVMVDLTAFRPVVHDGVTVGGYNVALLNDLLAYAKKGVNTDITSLAAGLVLAGAPTAGDSSLKVTTTSWVAAALTGYIPTTSIGSANGVAGLDSGGKVPTSQLPSSITGALNYQGGWNASTNTPALASGSGTKGFYYKVTTAGATNLDGITQWNVGDTAAFDGSTWDKIDGIANEVITVAGRYGNVVLTVTDVSGAATSGANSNITSLTGLTTALTLGQGGTGATTAAGARASLGAAASGANTDITSLGGLTTTITIAQGGTGAATAAGARSNLGAAASGANSDITSLTGLTTAIPIAEGGTGATTAAAARTALAAAASGANTDITSLGSTGNLALMQIGANSTRDNNSDIKETGTVKTSTTAQAYTTNVFSIALPTNSGAMAEVTIAGYIAGVGGFASTARYILQRDAAAVNIQQMDPGGFINPNGDTTSATPAVNLTYTVSSGTVTFTINYTSTSTATSSIEVQARVVAGTATVARL